MSRTLSDEDVQRLAGRVWMCPCGCVPGGEDIALAHQSLGLLLSHVEQLTKERDALATRRDELLAAMVRVANETPFADEAKDALAQRGKLLAEIGTLKAERDELAAKLADAHEQLDACCERCLDKCPHAPKEQP